MREFTRREKDIIFYISMAVISAVFILLVIITNNQMVSHPEDNKKETILQSIIFSDVPNDSAYAEAIYYLVSKNILSGNEDGSFLPNKVATKVEAIKMIIESSEIERNNVQMQFDKYIQSGGEDVSYLIFPDIPKNSWFSPYVYAAYRLNMVQGTSDGKFHADKSIKLSEFLKMLLIMERENLDDASKSESPFIGVEAHEWFTPYFVRSKKLGILPILDEISVDPDEELTKARIAYILYKYKLLRTKESGMLSPAINTSSVNKTEKSYLEDKTQ